MKKVLFLMFSSLMMIFLSSCEKESDVMMINSVEMSEVIYTFDIPEETYMYYSLDGFHNATVDAAHDVVIDSRYTVKYTSKKSYQDCLFVLDCTRTNRPIDRDFIVNVTVTIKSYMLDGTIKNETRISQININSLKQFSDKTKRGTWNVKIDPNGNFNYTELIK